jgi:hypothetical protein
MAKPGPAPTLKTSQRAESAPWTEVPNVPFTDGAARVCPTSVILYAEGKHVARKVPESVTRWWQIVATMPHACLWEDSDWLSLEDLAVIRTKFALGILSDTGISEMRRREDYFGLTWEARNKLRIRYVDEKPKETTAAGLVPGSYNWDSLLDEDDL